MKNGHQARGLSFAEGENGDNGKVVIGLSLEITDYCSKGRCLDNVSESGGRGAANEFVGRYVRVNVGRPLDTDFSCGSNETQSQQNCKYVFHKKAARARTLKDFGMESPIP